MADSFVVFVLLSAENVPQEYGGPRKAMNDQKGVDSAIVNLRAFKCDEPSCGHTLAIPNPPLLVSYESKRAPSTLPGVPKLIRSASELPPVSGRSMWRLLDGYLTKHTFDYLLLSELRQVHQCCRFFAGVLGKYRLTERRQLLCYHRKVGFEQDTLGYGFTIAENAFGKFEYKIEPDLLSYSAFKADKVRTGVWGTRFERFLPVIINERHSVNAFPIAEDTIRDCYPTLQSVRTFRPEQVLTVLGTLMNTMIVDLVKVSTDRDAAPALLQSERALIGYCSFHHLLLSFGQRYPKLARAADDRVANFIRYPTQRLKKMTPDLGEFLVSLSISSYSWLDVAIPLLRELFNRDVRWVIDKYPELAISGARGPIRGHQVSTCYRLRKHFEASITGKRLFMFQCMFLRLTRSEYRTSPKVAYESYNRSLGLPPAGTAARLQKACGEIMKINQWDHFFDFINVQRLPSPTLERMLIEAEAQSLNNEYHKAFWVKENPGQYPCCCQGTDKTLIRAMDGQRLCRLTAPEAYDAALVKARKSKDTTVGVAIIKPKPTIAAAPATAVATPVAAAATTATTPVTQLTPQRTTPSVATTTTPAVAVVRAPAKVVAPPTAVSTTNVTSSSFNLSAPVVATPVVTPVVPVVASTPPPSTSSSSSSGTPFADPRLLAVQFSEEEQRRARQWSNHLDHTGNFPTLSIQILTQHQRAVREAAKGLPNGIGLSRAQAQIAAATIAANAALVSAATSSVKVTANDGRGPSSATRAPAKTWAPLPANARQPKPVATSVVVPAKVAATNGVAATTTANVAEAKRAAKVAPTAQRTQLVSNRKDFVPPPTRKQATQVVVVEETIVAPVVVPAPAATPPAAAVVSTSKVSDRKQATAKTTSRVVTAPSAPVASRWAAPSNQRPVEQQEALPSVVAVSPIAAAAAAAPTPTETKVTDVKTSSNNKKDRRPASANGDRPRVAAATRRSNPFAVTARPSRPNPYKAPPPPELIPDKDGFTIVAKDRSVPNAPSSRRSPVANKNASTSSTKPATKAAVTKVSTTTPTPAVTTTAASSNSNNVDDNDTSGWTRVSNDSRRGKKNQ
jgi:hypothetical protein